MNIHTNINYLRNYTNKQSVVIFLKALILWVCVLINNVILINNLIKAEYCSVIVCQFYTQTSSNKTFKYVQCVLHVSISTLNPCWIHPYSGIREILIFSIKPILISTLKLWNTPNWHLIWILGRIGLPNQDPNFVGSGSHTRTDQRSNYQ